MPELAGELDRAAGVVPAAAPRGAEMASVRMAVPGRVVPNAAITDRLGVGGEWIARRTGVEERRVAESHERLADRATAGGAAALAGAGVDAKELDLVLVATMSADELTPNAAPLVAAQLGAHGAGAFDVGAACTAFVSALGIAAGQIEAQRAGTVLVVGADLLSRFTDPDDRATAGLLADGAGAAVVRATDGGEAFGLGGGRIGPVVLGSDGARADLIVATRDDGAIRMKGHDTFKHAVARMSKVTLEVVARARRELADVDLFVYHQANSRIIRALGEQLELPSERVVDYLSRFGNTSAATIPIALALAEQEGRLVPGDLVLLAAFGAGLTWGGTLVEWGGADA